MVTLVERWKELERRWQIGIVAGIVIVLISGAVLAMLYTGPRYEALVPGSAGDEAASTIAMLENLGVPYRVDPGSGDVQVRSDDKGRIQTLLAKRGFSLTLPPGFSLFDKGDFGMTEFTEHINYERALEGELTRTVMALDEVRFTRIHLVLPEKSLFRDDRQTPKASVLIALKPGRRLSTLQIGGIQRLIASAVPGLQPKEVSIHDDDGVDLAGGTTDGGLSSARVTQEVGAETAVEDHLTLKADEVLAQMFPAGGFNVSVSATLEQAHTVSTREEVLPTGRGSGAVSRISTSTPDANSVDMLRRAASGDKHAASDGPKPPTEFDVLYQIGHLTEHSERGPGAIARLSVGALIPDPSIAHVTIEQVRDLLGAALGIDASRGDRLAVYVATPGKGQDTEESPGTGLQPVKPVLRPSTSLTPYESLSWRNLLLFSGISICICLLALVLWFEFRRGRIRDLTQEEREALLGQIKAWLKA